MPDRPEEVDGEWEGARGKGGGALTVHWLGLIF